MDLNQAIEKHAEWKVKLRGAIARQETLEVGTVSKDNCCELGKWLHGEAKTKYGRLGSYVDCVDRHARFHIEAGKVAALINARKYEQAGTMLDGGTAYASASSAVAVAINHLKKEVGQ